MLKALFANSGTGPARAPSESALDLAQHYIDWCYRHGFLDRKWNAADLLDPDMMEPPRLSPLFDPALYRAIAESASPLTINPYLHYFEQGWTSAPALSRLVDPLVLQGQGAQATSNRPQLNEVIELLEQEDRFTCHALFDPALYRNAVPRRDTSAMIEFLRQPVQHVFSLFVDLDLLSQTMVTHDLKRENALICYLDNPLGLSDINPMFFSQWYVRQYHRVPEGMPLRRDPLSDFILIGHRKGHFPNPFLHRDIAPRVRAGTTPFSAQELLQSVIVAKYQDRSPDRASA